MIPCSDYLSQVTIQLLMLLAWCRDLVGHLQTHSIFRSHAIPSINAQSGFLKGTEHAGKKRGQSGVYLDIY